MPANVAARMSFFIKEILKDLPNDSHTLEISKKKMLGKISLCLGYSSSSNIYSAFNYLEIAGLIREIPAGNENIVLLDIEKAKTFSNANLPETIVTRSRDKKVVK